LIGDPSLRNDLGARGRDSAVVRFDAEGLADLWAAIYG
jgi:hypothetical protein